MWVQLRGVIQKTSCLHGPNLSSGTNGKKLRNSLMMGRTNKRCDTAGTQNWIEIPRSVHVENQSGSLFEVSTPYRYSIYIRRYWCMFPIKWISHQDICTHARNEYTKSSHVFSGYNSFKLTPKFWCKLNLKNYIDTSLNNKIVQF